MKQSKTGRMIHMAGSLLASFLVLSCTAGGKSTLPPAAAPKPAADTRMPEPPAPAVVETAESPDEGVSLESKVVRVTVYSDRARLTRQAAAQASGTEPVVFAFHGLPGWVDDGSVQVSASSGRILDVRAERKFLARANDASWRRAEAEYKAMERQLAALRDELAVLDAQRAQIETIRAFSQTKVRQDAMIGNVQVKTYADVLAFISESLRATARARREVLEKIDALTPEFEAASKRLEDVRALMKLEETTVLVTLQPAAPGALTLELTYMLPGVTWEPLHELRVSSADPGAVELVTYASVSQTSGEDWGNAEISFSTQSSTQSVHIPELEALTLGDTQMATRVMTQEVSSFARAQNAFVNQSQLWNTVRVRSSKRVSAKYEEVYKTNFEYLQMVQGRTVTLFASLEKRGTTAHFHAQRVQSVRGDGHPVRLLIGRARLSAVRRTVAAPEQSLNAAVTLFMTNTADWPLLPGKVARYLDGTFLGMTEVDFIAKGEQFSLFLAVADHLKISRQLDRKQSALVRKTRTQMQVAFIVTVENLAAEPATFTLADRIPVSENREIRVDRVAVVPAAKPDSQGIVRWDVTLKPGERREFRVGYQLEYPNELVFETRRRQMQENAPYQQQQPAPAKSRVEDQILNLEQLF